MTAHAKRLHVDYIGTSPYSHFSFTTEREREREREREGEGEGEGERERERERGSKSPYELFIWVHQDQGTVSAEMYCGIKLPLQAMELNSPPWTSGISCV